MKRKEIALIALCFVLISISCEEKFAERDFPSVITSNIYNRGFLGIEFAGELILRGSEAPDEVGFIWQNGIDPALSPGYSIDVPGVIKTGKFSVLINTSLKKESKYYVRAYAISGNTTIYGDLYLFTCPADFVPGIKSVTPLTGHVGDTVTIKGGVFNTIVSNNNVKFNNAEAEILTASDSIIKCIVPTSLTSKENTISVINEGLVSVFSETFKLITPTIGSVSPAVVFFRDTISITGTGFHRDIQFNSVKIGNINATLVTSSPIKLTAVVPYTIDSMCFVSVSVSGQTATTSEKIKVKIPDFDLFEPLSADYLDTITIHCKNLRAGDIKSVLIDNISARIISSGTSSIKVEVPTGLKKANSDIKINLDPGEFIFNYKFHLNQPVITGLSSVKVFNQQLLTISGSGFNPVKSGNRVDLVSIQFGTVYSFTPVTAGSNSMEIKIQNPANPALSIPSGEYTLSVGTCEESFPWGTPIEVADAWRKLGNFPGGARYKGGAFAINGKGYAGLGTRAGNDIQKDLWEFNPATESWTRKADFPGNARILPCVFVNSTFGFLGGGQSLDNYASQVPYTDFYKFNPVMNSWARIADAPAVQKSFPGSYASTSSNIHIANLSIGSILKYSETSNAWSLIYTGDAALYSGPSVFSINNKVYIVGGIDSQGSNVTSNKVFEYDTETNTVIRKNDFPGTSRWAGYGFSIGNHGYVGGGYRTDNGINTVLTDVYQYHPENDSWVQMPSCPSNYSVCPSSFVIGGKAYIVFGVSLTTLTSEVWEFYPGL